MEKKQSTTKVIITLLILGTVGYYLFNYFSLRENDVRLMDLEQKKEQIDTKLQGDPPPSEPPVGTEGYTPGKELSDYFKPYSNEELENAFMTNKKVLLFFSASWCPTCQGAKRDLGKNYMELPDDLVILEIDYDTEKELKEKYSIVVQHTFVQIDSSGNEITTWNGGGVKAIIDNIE